MIIKALRQARNAFVWNLNTDLDNIPACDQWAKMLRKNIDDLDLAIDEWEKAQWVGLDRKEMLAIIDQQPANKKTGLPMFYRDQVLNICRGIEAKLKEKNQ
jgi:hypothetical protein